MAALSPDQWRLLSPYLDQALTLSEAERAHWLEVMRAENPTLAAQLEELLSEHRAAEQKAFLQQGPDLATASLGLAGQIVGADRLISSAGQGGMGTVWLAERRDGRFERNLRSRLLLRSLRRRV